MFLFFINIIKNYCISKSVLTRCYWWSHWVNCCYIIIISKAFILCNIGLICWRSSRVNYYLECTSYRLIKLENILLWSIYKASTITIFNLNVYVINYSKSKVKSAATAILECTKIFSNTILISLCCCCRWRWGNWRCSCRRYRRCSTNRNWWC